MKFIHKFLQYNTKVKHKIRNQYKIVLNKKVERTTGEAYLWHLLQSPLPTLTSSLLSNFIFQYQTLYSRIEMVASTHKWIF